MDPSVKVVPFVMLLMHDDDAERQRLRFLLLTRLLTALRNTVMVSQKVALRVSTHTTLLNYFSDVGQELIRFK